MNDKEYTINALDGHPAQKQHCSNLGAAGKKRVNKLPAINTSLCSRCNKCIKVCPQKAIQKTQESLDITCAKCIKYCISMTVPCSPESIFFAYDLCDACGLCIASCPQDAIYWNTGGFLNN